MGVQTLSRLGVGLQRGLQRALCTAAPVSPRTGDLPSLVAASIQRAGMLQSCQTFWHPGQGFGVMNPSQCTFRGACHPHGGAVRWCLGSVGGCVCCGAGRGRLAARSAWQPEQIIKKKKKGSAEAKLVTHCWLETASAGPLWDSAAAAGAAGAEGAARPAQAERDRDGAGCGGCSGRTQVRSSPIEGAGGAYGVGCCRCFVSFFRDYPGFPPQGAAGRAVRAPHISG